eukprot:CAMPEP_0117884958 /NCGR_PEP_ID=MMETSP0950-20121206/19272_1 /TAXON_ID=44440 /ORGANISM="Chattonella subsalsa, Strain CCMP2191" /LENGTH=370 /DNA_ID=CAMNT_0005741589 /DNA_START=78 /DNA_END=1190 /DNA_ORIENTATION=-
MVKLFPLIKLLAKKIEETSNDNEMLQIATEIQEDLHKDLQDENKVVDMLAESKGQKKDLLQFYHLTRGRFWKSQYNWISQKDYRHWHGVVCNENGEVISLKLPLHGMFNEALLENFKELEELDLSGNNLFGTLPQSLKKLKKLRYFNIVGNLEMIGSIPECIYDKCSYENTQLEMADPLSMSFPQFPFYVYPKQKLLDQESFLSFEEAKENEKLLVKLHVYKNEFLSTWQGRVSSSDGAKQEVKIIVHRHNLLFVSHLWKITGKGGQDSTHNESFDMVMKQLKDVLNREEFKEVQYVWMEGLCMPQKTTNPDNHGFAYSSIPYYVKSCKYFVALCCEGQKYAEVSTENWKKQGWQRFQQLCAAIPIPDPE